MTTYISILRGINVGGHKSIRMNDLKAFYEELNFLNVRTYIQSGNVIFESGETDYKILASEINKKIMDKYNFDVQIIIRTNREMLEIFNKNPYLNDKAKEIGKIYITFLSDYPCPDYIKKISEYNFAPDEFIISGREVFVYCPNSYGKTKLTNTFFENKLKVYATTRNINTVNELLKFS